MSKPLINAYTDKNNEFLERFKFVLYLWTQIKVKQMWTLYNLVPVILSCLLVKKKTANISILLHFMTKYFSLNTF